MTDLKKYEVRIILGYGSDSKAIATSVFTDTYPEIEILDLKGNSIVVNEIVRVKEVVEIWLKSISNSVKPQTLHKYQRTAYLYIIPHIGEYDVRKVNTVQINKLLEKMSIDGGHDNQGLSLSSLKTITFVIKEVFKYAYNYGFRSEMINDVIIPKKRNKSRIKVLEEHEYHKLMKYLLDDPKGLNIGLLISICCGLRIGEVCTLKGKDINYDKGSLSITHTMQRIHVDNQDCKTRVVINSPKSETSIREVPIPDLLMKVLKNIECDSQCYLLTNNENFIEPRRLTKYFKKILNYLEIKDTNYHVLRHTFASICIASGMDDRTLSEILGHSSVNITLDRYVHPTMKTKQEMINKVNFI